MEKNNSNSVDHVLSACIVALVAGGLLMNLSASYISSGYKYGNVFFFFQKHFFYSVAGVILMIAVSFIRYDVLKKVVLFAFAASMVVLALVLLGPKVNGAKRWLKLGPVKFQPVEFAKYGIILFLVNYYYKHKENIGTFFRGIVVPVAFVMPALVLIFLQPNRSAIMLLSATILFIMFVAGVKIKHLLYCSGAAVPALIFLITRKGYSSGRVATFLDPFKDVSKEGYQVVQSFLAFYSGGFWGRGLGESIQKLNYLPEAHNDFIFSIIAEETGFFGTLVVVGLFFIVVYRGMRIAIKSKDDFAKLLAFGITTIIACQAIVNFFVVTGLGPATGVPLPFVSYGGTSLLVSLASAGVLLNISRSIEK